MQLSKRLFSFRITMTIHRRLTLLSFVEGLMVTIPVAIMLGIKPGKDFLNIALIVAVLYWAAGYFGEEFLLRRGYTSLESKILGGSFFAFLTGPSTVGLVLAYMMYQHGFMYAMYGKNVLINAIASVVAFAFCMFNVWLMMQIWDRKTPACLR